MLSYRFKTNVISIISSLTLLGLIYFGTLKIYDIKNNPKKPRYSCTTSSNIWFDDDIAPGMRAFIDYGNGEREMQLSFKRADCCGFEMPKGALETKEFTVRAVDRNGNASKPKTLYTLEGVVLEKSPN